MRHPLVHADVDLAEVAERIGRQLGHPVGIAARRPTADAPGVLVVEDAATGERIAVPWPVVARAIADTRAGQRTKTATAPTTLITAAGLRARLRQATDDTTRWAVVDQILRLLADTHTAHHERPRTPAGVRKD